MIFMLVTITSFGSIWNRRFGKDANDPRRFARAAYYNTTGIRVADKLRHRGRWEAICASMGLAVALIPIALKKPFIKLSNVTIR
jgi:hypothetical protein